MCSFLLVSASTLENSRLFVLYNNSEFINIHFSSYFWPHVFHLFRFKNGQGSGLDGGQYRVYINGTLEIKQARVEDEGTYTCVANSILGTAENQVHLEVKGQTLYHCTQMKPESSCFTFALWRDDMMSRHVQQCTNLQHDIKCISNSIFYEAGWYLMLYTSTTYQDNNVK